MGIKTCERNAATNDTNERTRKQANELKERKFCKFSEMKVNVLKRKYLQI